ncbi:MerR family transcriptional regulator [Spiroplasma culicicola]|uniref:MerR family transcriptional regulator n=1 Tax=Spiroplasma culicicola AES-1 TaxID=1276246 RepID=W6A6B6_9MOLU|nr:MerR family transcriptional regulator [Spiroplasma culicicola]AHI52385.1 MerR family transcriptional regulator [Spiroplasma culicicola AES-1]
MKKIYLKELASRFNLNESTIRFYDSKGLFPMIYRDVNKYRYIHESDLNWIQTVICLKKTGMSLKEIKHYLDLVQIGESTIKDRYNMILKQEKVACKIRTEIEDQIKYIKWKKTEYENILKEMK